jgi:hypothetical protein
MMNKRIAIEILDWFVVNVVAPFGLPLVLPYAGVYSILLIF